MTAVRTDPDPRALAARLVAEHHADGAWLDRFAEELDRGRAVHGLERVMAVWGLTQAEVARLFGVSRQAVGKWVSGGVPVERVPAFADLAAATDLLVRQLRRDRIPAVVRRPAPALGDRSLVDLVAAGRTGDVLAACRAMFAFDQVQA